MKEIISVLCLTFLALVVIYWIMPTKKMKAVNEAITKTTISKDK